MLIQCTKSLLDKMKIDKNKLVAAQGYEQFQESFTSWHADSKVHKHINWKILTR